MTLSTPFGKMSGGELGQRERGQRRHRRGLEHDRVARRERRAQLPDRHHQRVVPRRDLADDADRLAPDHARPALARTRPRPCLRCTRAAPAKKRRLSMLNSRSKSADALGLADVRRLELRQRLRRRSSIVCAHVQSIMLRSPGRRLRPAPRTPSAPRRRPCRRPPQCPWAPRRSSPRWPG